MKHRKQTALLASLLFLTGCGSVSGATPGLQYTVPPIETSAPYYTVPSDVTAASDPDAERDESQTWYTVPENTPTPEDPLQTGSTPAPGTATTAGTSGAAGTRTTSVQTNATTQTTQQTTASAAPANTVYGNVQMGIVSTAASDLNLRCMPYADMDVLARIPKGTEITILATAVICGEGTWYLAEYGGKTGYVAGDYIQLTGRERACTELQICAIAQMRLMEGTYAAEWEYEPLMDIDYGNTYQLPETQQLTYLVKGVSKESDMYAVVHKLFAARYDNTPKRGRLLRDVLDEGYVVLGPGQYYKIDQAKGALDVDLLHPKRHQNIRLTVTDTTADEIFFRGTLVWDGCDIYYDPVTVRSFSMVNENGVWKCGVMDF